tara:strand:- start:574 stop:972 length:399 start_codon:yes stop_codon:yes gene_type:complete
MNQVKKNLFLILLLCFTFNGYSDVSNFKVGDVFESKKRSTSVLLYKSKLDLHQRVRVPNAATGAHTLIYGKYTYTLQKGDKIILLESLEERGRQLYRVALVPRRKAKYLENPYFYVVPDNFDQLVFVEHLTE